MARITAVLRAVGRASWREFRTFQSITGQNFFYLVAVIALQPESAAFFAVILAALLIFPLSSDPLEKIPHDRRKLWPLDRGQWLVIRIATIFLSPVIWIALYLLRRMGWKIAVQLAVLGIVTQLAARFGRRFLPNFNLLRYLPAPPGVIGLIMRLHWREMLTTLDPYVALLLAGSTAAYRFSGRPLDPTALPILSMIVVVALSTSAQVLIGLDGAGAQRYRLMPIRGWQILLAKDLAFLTILLILIAPLEIPATFTAGLAALAVGHYGSTEQAIPQQRWRFTSGVLLPTGALQMFAIFSVGNAVAKFGPVVIVLTAAVWLGSVFWFGRKVVAETN